MTTGYVSVYTPKGVRLEHMIVAVKALGRPLPKGAHIHHINRNGKDNRGTNLVICPNHAYHHLLHQRQRALDACGHANWRKCIRCGNYDDPSLMYVAANFKHVVFHRNCERIYQNNRRNKA